MKCPFVALLSVTFQFPLSYSFYFQLKSDWYSLFPFLLRENNVSATFSLKEEVLMKTKLKGSTIKLKETTRSFYGTQVSIFNRIRI